MGGVSASLGVRIVCLRGRVVRRVNGIDSPREDLRGPGSNPGRGTHIFHQTSLILLSKLHN